jgi:hypothetical protein
MMRALFTISLLELFIGGGGRLTAVGPVSLRMLLFAACLCATAVALLFPRRRSDGVLLAMFLVLIYLLIHVAGWVVGAIYSSDGKEILTEFQQSLYWLAAPFFALMIQSEQDVLRYARVVQMAGVLLASMYLAILLGLLTGVIHLSLVRSLIAPSGEVVFRSGEFFIYKGFIYLGISIVFFVALRGKYWTLLAVWVAFAMVFTFTRGFLISAAAAMLLMLCFQGRWRAAAPALFLVACGAFVIWVYLPSLDTKILGNYDASTNERLQDLAYMVDHVSLKTLLIGEGFGSMINDRYLIENTFLWALWKLGIAGLLFWMLPMALCIYYYSKIPDRRTNSLANAYFFGTVLVYLQTMVNPYVNNPIGLSFVLLAIFSLRRLSRCRQPQVEMTLDLRLELAPSSDRSLGT